MGTSSKDSINSREDYFQGGGEMGELVRRFNWSQTPLGAVETWQESLKIAVRNMLNSRFPMFVWWGDALINIYNDGYAPVLGKKHSDALGQPAKEIWSEIWKDLEAQVQGVMNDGIASWNEEVLLFMERKGFAEETYFTWSYSPLTDDAGNIGGLFCACTEDTAKVLSRRRMTTLHLLSEQSNQAENLSEACEITAKVLEQNSNDATFALLYSIDETDAARADLRGIANLAANEKTAPPHINLDENDWWNFNAVNGSGETHLIENLREKFDEMSGGAWVDAPIQAAILPIKKAGGDEKPIGFLIVGINPNLAFDEEYRSFLELVAAQIATAIANAQTFETEKKRVEILAELDRANRQRQESDQQTTEILESLNDGFVALDREYRITYVNRQGEILLSRKVLNLLGKIFWDEFPMTVGSSFELIYRRAMNDKIASSVIDFYADHQRWYEVSAFPSPNGITIIFRNITESYRAAEKLRESEERFRNMADHAPVMIWVTEPDGYCSYLSESWYEFTGQTPEVGLGFGWANATHPDDQQPAHDTFVAANEKQEFFRIEYRLRRQDGVYRWAIDSAQPRFGEDGKFLGYIGSVIDITERKEAEEKLRDSEMRYRTLFDSIDEGFYISQLFFDEMSGKAVDYRYLEVNPSFENLTGLKNAKGKLVSELVPNLESNWFEIYGKVALTGESARFENHSDELDGRIFDVYAFRVGEPHENKVAVIFNNITERKKSERERQVMLEREQELRRQAETANRLKDEFLATVSHELRTPLNAILGWSNMLQSGRATGETIARANQTIYRNAKSQAQLIEDLLDVSRIISGKLKFDPYPVELISVIESAIDSLRPAVEAKSIELEMLVGEEPLMLKGDQQRLQQIVWNLISNAVKFTPERGKITVQLDSDGANARLIITDSGKGIESEFLPYLFERFRQEDASNTRRHGGLGLGLAIVRHLTELHGGKVSATSAGGNQGATFTLELPLIAAWRSRNKSAANSVRRKISDGDFAAQPKSKQLSGVRLLLVDDERDTLEMLDTALKYEGAEVQTANSAATAWEIFQTWQPDIIVSDIAMPDEDGYSLIGRIRELAPEKGGAIPAVAMTAYVRVEDRLRVLSSGFQMYIPKPAEPQELINAVRNLRGSV